MLGALKSAAACGARRLVCSALVQNIGALYLIRCAAYVAPLLTLPWLARVLGPHGLGLLAFVQGIGACVILIVEYGFSFSATQEVSVHRHSPERLSAILAGVQGSKAVLAAACVVCAAVLQPVIPMLEGRQWLLAAGLFAATGQAFTMTWYFLGIERMMAQSVLEAVLRLGAAAAVLVLVHQPGDAWKVFALQGLAAWLTAGAGMVMAYRMAPFQWPTPALVKQSLSRGSGALFFRVAETSYTSCNALLLGFLFPANVVGVYASAERIARSILIALLDPVQRAVYPGVARALAVSQAAAARLVRLSAVATVTTAVAISALLFAAAPAVVRVLLGPGYEPSVPVLRLLLVVPVAVALKWALGLNWMIPLGQGRAFNAVIAGSAVFHLAATFTLAARWGALGMAATVAVTEAAIPACVYLILRRRELDPFLQVRPSAAIPEFQHDPERKVPCC